MPYTLSLISDTIADSLVLVQLLPWPSSAAKVSLLNSTVKHPLVRRKSAKLEKKARCCTSMSASTYFVQVFSAV